MTREKSIDILDDNFTVIDTHGHYSDEEVEQARKMAIKALEQESILDKIRAEIEALEEGITSYHNDRPWIFKDEALAIVDKYKAESEEEV